MARSLLLYFRTIRHLTLKQIVYQIFYRLKSVKPLTQYKKKYVHFSSLSFSIKKKSPGFYKGNNSFIFLNQSHNFQNEINWNFLSFGKLWNYHLQYFEYLEQEDVATSVKIKWLSEVGHWLEDGRLGLEPYPVSLRVINTVKFLSTNRINQQSISDNVFGQLNFLNRHLEYHLLGNHLLENGFALFMGGHAFQNIQWQEKAKKLLYCQLEEQVLSDGAHFELSAMYHQIILFRLIELIDWYGKIKDPDPAFLEFVKEKARKMLAWLQIVTFKNGDIPHFNDSSVDMAIASNELTQHAYTLKLEPSEIPGLDDSGYRKYCFDDYECIIDVAKLGPSYQAGHGHADALSFILYKSGHPFIIEAGTSTYHPGQRRDYERSTLAHNTVVVNGKNQSEVWGNFRVGRRASVKILSETLTELEAMHNGYYQTFGNYHTRKFSFSANEIKLVDHIGDTDGKLLLHFHPGYQVLVTPDNFLLIPEIALVKFEKATQICLKDYECAEGFNRYKKACKVEVEFTGEIKTTIRFL